MGKTENLCKNPVRFFLFKRFFGVSKETEKQLLNQQLIALLKSKERPKWHQTFHDFHVCCGTLLKYTSGIKWCLAADSDLKAFLNEHTGKWLLPELACLGFQHCAVLQELKTPWNDMQTKWWAAASLFCSVCVCVLSLCYPQCPAGPELFESGTAASVWCVWAVAVVSSAPADS